MAIKKEKNMPKKIHIPEDSPCQELMAQVKEEQKRQYGQPLAWHISIEKGLQLYLDKIKNQPSDVG